MPVPGLIAVVDDDEDVRFATRDLLRAFGMKVLVFDSAEAFLAGADLAEIAALITDFRMPGMDGAALLEVVRERAARLPVIVMSGLEPEPTRSVVMAKGALAFLPKPLDPDELARVLEHLPSRRALNRDDANPPISKRPYNFPPAIGG